MAMVDIRWKCCKLLGIRLIWLHLIFRGVAIVRGTMLPMDLNKSVIFTKLSRRLNSNILLASFLFGAEGNFTLKSSMGASLALLYAATNPR